MVTVVRVRDAAFTTGGDSTNCNRVVVLQRVTRHRSGVDYTGSMNVCDALFNNPFFVVIRHLLYPPQTSVTQYSWPTGVANISINIDVSLKTTFIVYDLVFFFIVFG